MSSKQKSKHVAPNKSKGRKSLLIEFIEKKVSVITNDGRQFVGYMRGYDQVCNIILEKCVERVFETNLAMRTVSSDALNTFVIRGDNIAIIGEIDIEKDDKMAWNSKKVSTITPRQITFSSSLHLSPHLICIR